MSETPSVQDTHVVAAAPLPRVAGHKSSWGRLSDGRTKDARSGRLSQSHVNAAWIRGYLEGNAGARVDIETQALDEVSEQRLIRSGTARAFDARHAQVLRIDAPATTGGRTRDRVAKIE